MQAHLPSSLCAPRPRILPCSCFWYLLAIAGCGSGGSLSTSAPVVYPNITGNWQIQTNAGTQNLGVLLVGLLSETNSIVSGTLQFTDLVPGNACSSAPYTIGVNGAVSSDGKLTLTTAPGANGPMVQADLQLSPGAYNYAYETVAATAPSQCVYASTSALGVHVGDVTGRYTVAPALTGAISGVGISSTTLSLTQATSANADGSFAVSGSLAFGGSACSVSLPVQGTILNVALNLPSAQASGASSQPEVSIDTTANSDRLQLYDTSILFNSGPCAATASGFADDEGILKRAN